MTPTATDPATAPTDPFYRVLGEVLRTARNNAGFSREQLVNTLPGNLHTRTLSSYECGDRSLAVLRFVQYCLAIGVNPADTLTTALQRISTDHGIPVDLTAVLRDRTAGTAPLRRWAANHATDGATITEVSHHAVKDMAAFCGWTEEDLINYLRSKAPQHY